MYYCINPQYNNIVLPFTNEFTLPGVTFHNNLVNNSTKGGVIVNNVVLPGLAIGAEKTNTSFESNEHIHCDTGFEK